MLTGMKCRFEGHAIEVRIEGTGSVQLTTREAFSAPFAARVELTGARVGPAGPFVEVEPAGDVEPVEMAWQGADYDVTYRAGPLLEVQIDAGGEAGHVRGRVDGAPECGSKWCDIAWTKGQAKKVSVKPVELPSAAVPVTGAFPFDQPGALEGEVSSKVLAVTAIGAKGNLHCDDATTAVDGATLVWRAAESGTLAVRPGVVWSHGVLSMTVESERPPAGARAMPWLWIVVVAVGLLAVLGVVWLMRRRRARGQTPAVKPALAREMPPPEEPSPEGVVDLYYSYAPEDERLLEELVKHVRLLERRGLVRGWHRGSIPPGEDHRKQIEAHLDRARLVLLLVSADYIASDECGAEMKRALERQAAGHCKVIPVLLRKVAGWEKAPFGALLPLPRNGRPVTDKEAWPALDDAFAEVAAGVEAALSSDE